MRPDTGAFLRLYILVLIPRLDVFSFGLTFPRPRGNWLQKSTHAATHPRIKSNLACVFFSHVVSKVLSCYAAFQMFQKSSVFRGRSKNISEHHVLYCLVMSCTDIQQDFFFFFFIYNTIYYYYYYCSRNPAGKRQKRLIITK